MDIRLKLTDEDRERLNVLFLAKHALGDGSPHPEDGVHATYHYELARILLKMLPNLQLGSTFEDVISTHNTDFVFTLLNRASFKNSEMLGPLLSVWKGLAHLGGSPILRGVGDDKHLAKLCARARGVSTPDSEIYRYGGVSITPPSFQWERLVIKPNASSASWGIKIVDTWEDALAHINWIFNHPEHHDVIVEAFFDGIELAVPVIGGADGQPIYLPVMKYSSDDDRIRTYEEKRQLVASSESWGVYHDEQICGALIDTVKRLMPEFWPFDYGRLEFKMNPDTGVFALIEINMSCNLWSKKTVANSWKSLGFSYPELIETILTHSLLRQNIIQTYVRADG